MATKTFGTLVTVNGTTIGELLSVKPGAFSREVIDVTHMTSPNEFQEIMLGVKTWGECVGVIQLDHSDASHQALLALRNSDDLAEVVVTHTDENNTTATFDAGLTGFAPDLPENTKATAEITFAISGDIEFA